MTVYFYTYTHQSYSLTQIQHLVQQNGCGGSASWMYLAATRKLEQVHGNHKSFPDGTIQTLASEWQKRLVQNATVQIAENEEETTDTVRYVCMFKNALQQWFKRKGVAVFSSMQERTLFRRAIRTVAANNKPLEQQLLSDEQKWLEAFERGALQNHQVEDLMLSPKLYQIYVELWRAFEAEQQRSNAENNTNRRSFSECLKEYAKTTDFWPTHIIMEGFSVLRPIQKYWMQHLEQMGCVFHIVLPYRVQHEAYMVIDTLYDFWQQHRGQESVYSKSHKPSNTQLSQLDAELFTEDSGTYPDDVSISLHQFPFQQDEVKHAVDWICSHRPHLLDPEQEATSFDASLMIVTKRREHFVQMLQEEVQRRGLNIPIQDKRFSVLFTPVGRFLLSVYQCHVDGEFHLESQVFRQIVLSNFIDPEGSDTWYILDRFLLRYCQNCRTYKDWNRTLSTVIRNRTQGNVKAGDIEVSLETLRQWLNILTVFYKVVRSVFANTQEASISQKAQELLEHIVFKNQDVSIKQDDRVIIEYIRQQLQEIEDNEDLSISTTEFGEILLGLMQESDEDRDDVGIGLSIVGPESTEGVSVDHILVIGCDDVHFPTRFSPAWPFNDAELEDHINSSRFLFHSVVRACCQTLSISWSQFEHSTEYRASPYLLEIYDRMQEKLQQKRVEIVPSDNPERIVQLSNPSKGKIISIEEIAQYRLCPYRYYVATTESWRKSPNNAFNQIFHVTATWLEALYEYYQTQTTVYQGSEKRAMLDNAIQHAHETTKDAFPSLQEHELREIQKNGAFQTRYRDGENFFKRYVYKLGVVKSVTPANGQATFGSTTVTFPIHYQIHNGKWTFIEPNVAVYATFGNYGRTPDNDAYAFEIERIEAPYLYDASLWLAKVQIAWFATSKKFQKEKPRFKKAISDILAEIKKGHFPKRTGEHCQFCPMRSMCLGDAERHSVLSELEEVEQETDRVLNQSSEPGE